VFRPTKYSDTTDSDGSNNRFVSQNRQRTYNVNQRGIISVCNSLKLGTNVKLTCRAQSTFLGNSGRVCTRVDRRHFVISEMTVLLMQLLTSEPPHSTVEMYASAVIEITHLYTYDFDL